MICNVTHFSPIQQNEQVHEGKSKLDENEAIEEKEKKEKQKRDRERRRKSG